MIVKNPLTGDFSCPKGYEAVPINNGELTSQRHRTEKKKCGWFFHLKTCVKNYIDTASADYSAYWCAAKEAVSDSGGYMFGGLYTQNMENVVTQTKGCPLYFTPLKILVDLTICVSDDYEQGSQFNLPFAGLFSCAGGNPLSLDPSKRTTVNYPHSCPQGYSQHLAVIDDGCEVEYCIQYGAITAELLPKIRLPPYTKRPLDIPVQETKDDSSVTIFSADGSSWSSLEEELVKAASKNNTGTFESAKQTALNIPHVKSLVMANLSVVNILKNVNENPSTISDVKQSEMKTMSSEKVLKPAKENSALPINVISAAQNVNPAAHNVMGMDENTVALDEAGKDYEKVSGITIAVMSVIGTLLAVLIVMGIVLALRRKWRPATPYQKI